MILPYKKLRNGFIIFIAAGAALASTLMAAALTSVAMPIVLFVASLFKKGLTADTIAAPFVGFFFFGVYAAFFCFKFSLIPNLIALAAILRWSNTPAKSDNFLCVKFLNLWSGLYGVGIFIVSYLIFIDGEPIKAVARKPDVFTLESPIWLFLLLLPVAAVSGMIAIKILSAMYGSALKQLPTSS